jgi:MFS transporter, FHS family, L-fucose permease
MFMAYFTFGMITNVLGVIIPEVIKQYSLSLAAGGILPLAFFLAYGLCSIPTGLLMERVGSRPMMIAGGVLMGLGCLVVALARNYPLTAAMIFAVGVGVTILQTVGNPLIHRLDRSENYHRNLTLTIGFAGIGAFTGPFVLTFFRSSGRPWQTLYIFFAILSLVMVALMAVTSFPAEAGTPADRLRLNIVPKILFDPIVFTYTLGIFFYVGAEVGTASWIVAFFERIHHVSNAAPILPHNIFQKLMPTLPALIVSLFWGLQGVGRLVSSTVLNWLGSRRLLRVYAFMAMVCVVIASLGPTMVTAVGFAACGFFTSLLFTLVFSGAVGSFEENHGTISGLLCTAILGGAVIPPLVGLAGDHFNMRIAMMIPALCFGYVFMLSLFGRAKYD